MPLPPALESEFELVAELPTGKVFQCYQVKDMRKGGLDAVVRLLPENFAVDQSIVNRFHDFFSRFNDIPNRRYIPSVYSVVGVAGKDVYVVEEYCAGVSLSQFVEKNRKSETFIRDVTEILARVCEGLHHAHQKTISHLCVLPSDILIDEHDYSKVKLVGFGAQIFAEKGKIDYLSGESSRFVAPEVFKRGVFGPKADVYSLAVTIKEILPEFSQGSDLLGKALSITLKDRFTSARQFAANLKELAVTDPGAEPAPKVIQPVKPKGGLQPILKVTTEPSGATVKVNGQVLGTTATTGLTVPWSAGISIGFEKQGYQTETLILTSPPDDTTINVKLKPDLRLFSNPWGATVTINGETAGTTTREGLLIPSDKGEIFVEKEGFISETVNLNSPPSGDEICVELKPQTASVTDRLNWPFPSPESMSVPHKLWVSLLNGIRAIPMVGYIIGGLLVLSVAVALVNWSISHPGVEKQQSDLRDQLQEKDNEISRLKQTDQEKLRSQAELQKRLDDMQSQIRDKDKDITRLTQAEKAFKADFDKEVSDLRSQIKQKDSDIAKMKQTDQEKTKLQSELQKQLNDLKSQIRDKDKDILSHIQDKLAEQRLKNSFESQLSNANSELIKKSDEITRLKSAQKPTPTLPPVKRGDFSVNMDLVSAASDGNDWEVSRLLLSGADPNARNSNGHTGLMLACVNGHLEVVITLLKAGADKNLKSPHGWTALDFARQYKHTSLFPYLQ